MTTSLTINWTMTPGEFYNLYYSTFANVSPTTGTLVSSVRSPYVLTGLAFNTKYYYTIQTNVFLPQLPVSPTRCMAEGHAYYMNKHITGDFTAGKSATGNLYFYDVNNYTENGNPITRTRITPHVSNGLRKVKYISLQIDFQTGTTSINTALPPDQQLESLVGLQYSDDGGKTWSNERFMSLGMPGEYKNRVIFYKLGSSRNRVYKITDTNNCSSGINGAEISLELGAN